MKQTILVMVSMMLPALLAPQATQEKPKEGHRAAAHSDLPGVESEIKEVEARRFRALTEADLPTLERLLSDDLIYTHASGWQQTKTEFLASIRSGELLYHSIVPDDVKVRVYGSTAVVNGRAAFKVRAKGQELSLDLLYLEAYVKQNGRWQLAAWQSTRLAK